MMWKKLSPGRAGYTHLYILPFLSFGHSLGGVSVIPYPNFAARYHFFRYTVEACPWNWKPPCLHNAQSPLIKESITLCIDSLGYWGRNQRVGKRAEEDIGVS